MPSRQPHYLPAPHQHLQNGHHHHQNLHSTSPASAAVSPPSPTPQPLTPHDLNFSVIKRQLPALEAIIAKVSHTTIYAYSPSLSTWEKSNIEGCLFLLQLSPLPAPNPSLSYSNNNVSQARRYALFLLNRRHLSTWCITLNNPSGIDLSGPIIQLTGQATITDAADGTFGTSNSAVRAGGMREEEGEERIWGVWVYEDNAGGSTRNERAELDAAILACVGGEEG